MVQDLLRWPPETRLASFDHDGPLDQDGVFYHRLNELCAIRHLGQPQRLVFVLFGAHQFPGFQSELLQKFL